jgi:hypothetical protein
VLFYKIVCDVHDVLFFHGDVFLQLVLADDAGRYVHSSGAQLETDDADEDAQLPEAVDEKNGFFGKTCE